MNTLVKSFSLGICCAALLDARAASVSEVVVRQNWPWTPTICVEYTLSDVSEPVDISLQCFSGERALACNLGGVKGRLSGIAEPGLHRLEINPVKAFLNAGESIGDFKVVLTAGPVSDKSKEVLYKIIDLTTYEITDVTRGELLNGDYGAIETDFAAIHPGFNTTLPADDVLIWTGVTGKEEYATTKLVLRKIPAGSCRCYTSLPIPSADNVTLSSHYWIGVFEFTHKQMEALGIRGKTWEEAQTETGYWPTDVWPDDRKPAVGWTQYVVWGNAQQSADAQVRVTPDPRTLEYNPKNQNYVLGALIYNLKTKGTKVYASVNLPTQAQWQKALCAGAYDYYYDGLGTPGNVDENEQFARLGRYAGNGSAEDGPCTVGSFLPNAYGLYDMLGNVAEGCCDTYTASLQGEDPKGSFGSFNVAMMGGAYDLTAKILPSSLTTQQCHSKAKRYKNVGFRICITGDPEKVPAE